MKALKLMAQTRLYAEDAMKAKYTDWQVVRALNDALRVLAEENANANGRLFRGRALVEIKEGTGALPTDYLRVIRGVSVESGMELLHVHTDTPSTGEFAISGDTLYSGEINGVELCLSLHHLAHSFFDHLPNGLSRVEHRFLRQVPDLDSGHRNCLALMILIDPRHDLEERRLPCTVQTEHADFGTGKEGERNIPKNLSLGRHHLAHAVHREDVLSHT